MSTITATIEDINAEKSAEKTPPTSTSVLSLAEKTEKANQRIKTYTTASMVVGVLPFPVLDLLANTGIQLKMLHSLAETYQVPFKPEIAKSSISSLASSVLPVASAGPIAASIGKFIPVIGHALSYATLVVLNGAITYALGKVFLQHFASGGTFLTFDPEAVRDYFQEQFEEGKNVTNNLKKE